MSGISSWDSGPYPFARWWRTVTPAEVAAGYEVPDECCAMIISAGRDVTVTFKRNPTTPVDVPMASDRAFYGELNTITAVSGNTTYKLIVGMR